MHFRSIFAFTALAIIAGCSLVNSLDEVKKTEEGSYVGESRRETALPTADPPDAGPITPDAAPTLQGGAIVVGGLVSRDGAAEENVLAVLDPVTGKELNRDGRERFTLAAVRYDGLRDLWYLFESTNGDFVPGPGETVFLHVRSLDATGRWTELSKTAVPVPHFYESVAVLRDRLSYAAYAADAGGALELVTFDTSTPQAPQKMDSLPLARAPNITLNTRSTTGPGGTINLVSTNGGACDDAGVCDVEMLPVRIPNSGQPQLAPKLVVGQAARNAVVSGASIPRAELDLIVFPRRATGQPTFAQLFQPIPGTAEGEPTPFTVSDTGLRRAAVAECENVAFVVATNGDLNVHAIPLGMGDGGVVSKTPTGHSGQAVYFEPFTKTVLAPFNQGAGFDYSAFKLGGTAAAPALTRRETDWTPPSDVRPVLLGIRSPVPLVCP